MRENRIILELETCNRVLLAGAGGGFDVFSALPIYFHLRNRGVQTVLANLTFTNLAGATGRQLTPTALFVDSKSEGSMSYFPEKYLSEWFAKNGMTVSICCFQKTGPVLLHRDYRALCDLMDVDAVVLVDGGTDSLMRGDEAGLGTPHEDISSIVAANELEIEKKFLLSIGFGVDTYHGVNHFQFLHAVADLTAKGHFLGVLGLQNEMEEVRMFKEAYRYVEQCMPSRPSIVTTSIIAALEGKYGDYHSTSRTHGSKLWINPLMPIYWGFHLRGIADRCLYYDDVSNCETMFDLGLAIERFRHEYGDIRPWDNIPA